MDFADILESKGTLDGLVLGDEIKTPLIAAINGLGLQEIINKNWLIVHSAKM